MPYIIHLHLSLLQQLFGPIMFDMYLYNLYLYMQLVLKILQVTFTVLF